MATTHPALAFSLVLLVAGAADAAWSSVAGDEQRSRASSLDSFPRALSYRLGLDSPITHGPVVDGPLAYVLLQGEGNRSVLAKIDVERASAAPIAQVHFEATGIAMLGERVLVHNNSTMLTYDAVGQRGWGARPHAPSGVAAVELKMRCAPPAVTDEAMYVACVSNLPPNYYDGDDTWDESRPHVYAYDARSGQGVWSWTVSPPFLGIDVDAAPECHGCRAVGIAVEAGRVFAFYKEPNPAGYDAAGAIRIAPAGWRLIALDAETGAFRWEWRTPATPQGELFGTAVPEERLHPDVFAGPMLGLGRVHVQLDDLVALGASGSEVTWTESRNAALNNPGDVPSVLALWGSDVLMMAPLELALLNQSIGPVWEIEAPRAEQWSAGPVVAAREAAVVSGAGNISRLAFVDLGGGLEWIANMSAPVVGMAASDERLLVASGRDLYVYGRTEASIALQPDVAQDGPNGTRVLVDLRASDGVSGAATSYRATWGDGNATEWRSEPRFEHTYADAPGSYEARFEARNAANETGELMRTLIVGAPAQSDSIGPLATEGTGEQAAVTWLLVALVVLVALTLLILVILLARRRRVSPAEPTPGALFLGKYHVERELGAGTFGVAWLALHKALERRVVIKQLRREWAPFGDAAARFRREAKILAALDHPNVTRVYDVEEVGRAWYIVMEFVEGGSLEDRALPLTPANAGHVMLQVLEGLAYIHAKGVVHRDLKPANVLLTREGIAKLADFGVARGQGLEATMMTMAGTPGTPIFMAPEQLEGGQGDARSDLYSAAATAFRLLTGELYFGPTPRDGAELRRLVLESPPRIPAWLGGPIGAWLAKGLAKSPDARYQSADEMRRALMAAMGAGLPAAPPRVVRGDATVPA